VRTFWTRSTALNPALSGTGRTRQLQHFLERRRQVLCAHAGTPKSETENMKRTNDTNNDAKRRRTETNVVQLSDRSHLVVERDAIKITKSEFEELVELRPEQKGHVVIFGKMTEIPRYQQLFGDITYSFSGISIPPQPLDNKFMQKVLEFVNARETYHYSGILVNWYPDGEHYIGAHSDDERDLVKGAPIYSFSYGASRTFRFHEKTGGSKVIDIPLDDGTMVAMCGDCQKEFKHSVPKTKSCKNMRINLTVRAFAKKQPVKN
jgi:alkylated DNA repair dioxygenase AlkB